MRIIHPKIKIWAIYMVPSEGLVKGKTKMGECNLKIFIFHIQERTRLSLVKIPGSEQ